MKKPARIILTAALLLTALSASAQKPVQDVRQAFDEFVASLAKDKSITSSQRTKYSNGSEQTVNFAIPRKTSKAVSKFNDILTASEALSYSLFVKTAGTSDNSTFTVAYGDDNEERLQFGKHADHNYNVQGFHDSKDSTMRYVYALVWYNSNDSLKGSAYKIYGKDPQKEVSKQGKIDLGKREWVIDGDRIFGSGVVIDDDDDFDLDNLDDDDFTPRSTDGKPIKLSGKTKIKSSSDFISQFNNLHVLYTSLNDKYKDYRKCSGEEKTRMLKLLNLMAGVLNKANDMCSNYYNVINTDMKRFVADQLRDMAKESKVSYLGDGFRAIANTLISRDMSSLYRHPIYKSAIINPHNYLLPA